MNIKSIYNDVEQVVAVSGDSWLLVPKSRLIDVLKTLNQNSFECLSSLTAVDRGDFLEVVYHLFSYSLKETVVLKVRLEKGNASLPNAVQIYPSANWFEREAFDLFGINFEGHPNLERIMLPPDWIGHPLCKDYKEPEEYQGMTTTRK